ncbi:MAG: general secretion pathway protein GspB [Psychrosphaera sp.]|nr:general secretion pathway protein GspB [Psychrosphaera sp.]
MSYLLDALNKSRGEGDNQASTPQPMMYQQAAFSSDEGVNIYKWISIALALILTLLLGVVLGNRYSLTFTDNAAVQPIVQLPAQPLIQSSAQPSVQAVQAPVEKKAEKTPPIEAKPVETVAKTAEPYQEEIAELATEQTQAEPTVPYNEEPMMISGEPRKLKPGKALEDTGQNSISSDLLQKFNQAIRDSEDVDASYAEVQSQQIGQELETYFTNVAKITELTTQEQLQIPTLIYETHLYSSDIDQRRVKINGKNLVEQQWINSELQVVEIQRQFLILEMGHSRFSLPALTDWENIGP